MTQSLGNPFRRDQVTCWSLQLLCGELNIKVTDIMRVLFCKFCSEQLNAIAHFSKVHQSSLQGLKLVWFCCQSLRSFSSSQDQESDDSKLCAMLTWTKFELMTYNKKQTNKVIQTKKKINQTKNIPLNCFFFVRICTGEVFSLELGSPAVTVCFCTADAASIFSLCVKQEKSTTCKISGCAVQDNITVFFWTGKLKLEMTDLNCI